MTITEITDEQHFDQQLTDAGNKLVVVDFHATWCGPCRQIAPAYNQMSMQYHKAVFLKVDVDQCQDVAAKQGVSAMPTFILFKGGAKVDEQRGADKAALEAKIKKYYGGDGEEDEEEDSPVKGHIDLGPHITKAGCECLNESDDHPLTDAFTTKQGYLESDCDEQLIINIQFNQAVKLHSLRMYGPEENGPKNIKVFQNLPRTLDFDSAESNEPTQAIELKTEDVKEGSIIPLRFVKFQNVSNITIFIKDNFSGSETTRIDYLGFIGSTVGTTNMADFKRVAGKKGESH